MKAYVGQTRTAGLIEKLARLGIGECTQRGELPPRRTPFFYDNGAFGDWKRGRDFHVSKWWGNLRRMRDDGMQPDFIVIPDRVAGGLESLKMSRDWLDVVPEEFLDRCYLVVQEGMTPENIAGELEGYAGLFVGGATTEWKMDTAPAWIALAHSTGRRCHIGRVGPPARVRLAAKIGADSIDSSLPLRHAEHLEAFLNALQGDPP